MADPTTVVATYATQVAALRAVIIAYVQRAWGSLANYRDADIDRFVAAVVPVVVGGQRQVAALTDAYLASLQAATLGTPTRPLGIPTALLNNPRGVPPKDVYRRAGIEVWTALAKGEPIATAAARGGARAVTLAATDLQIAKTRASQHVLGRRPGVVGYRRALTGSKSCGLCVVASTQRYHKAQLMPIHPGCDCAVHPIFGGHDPGQVIDTDRLADVHTSIAERFGVSDASGRGPVDYRDALVVHEHGEIGAVLAVRGQKFTGPGDL